jgi:sulfatase modifying factor 1
VRQFGVATRGDGVGDAGIQAACRFRQIGLLSWPVAADNARMAEPKCKRRGTAILTVARLLSIVPTVLLLSPKIAAGDENRAAPLPLHSPFDAGVAKERQTQWAKFSAKAVIETNSIGMKLTLIPPGEFVMGRSESIEQLKKAFPYLEKLLDGSSEQAMALKSERPLHQVRIARPFYFGVSSVTVDEFGFFVRATGYRTDVEKNGKGGWGYDARNKQFSQGYNWRSPGFDQGGNHPVVNVSWNDATAFCEWLSKQERKTYRLPNEAEWEYACRCGTTTRYPSGDDPETLAKIGNVADASLAKELGVAVNDSEGSIHTADGFPFTSPVGKFQPNAFGLFDMVGNAGNWCSDFYIENYYAVSPVDDPKGPKSGGYRVVRGAGWHGNTIRCRSAYRAFELSSSCYHFLGFRVVREL